MSEQLSFLHPMPKRARSATAPAPQILKTCGHPDACWVLAPGLKCTRCLTEADFKRYPGWKQRLQRHDAKAAQAKRNFRKESNG